MPSISKKDVPGILGIAAVLVVFIVILAIGDANTLAGIAVAFVVAMAAMVRAWKKVTADDYSSLVWVFVAIFFTMEAGWVFQRWGEWWYSTAVAMFASFVVGMGVVTFSVSRDDGVFSFTFGFSMIGSFFLFLLVFEAIGFR